jgi:DNA primase
LYGLDIAKKEIAKTRQVVVVEGYTDVMAAHLAGVTTAVATCGTAFGDEHIRILRRLLMDDDSFRGEVIFTFDGDAAGQKAAMRAFGDDQKFVTQTFVAVEPNGLDPCDLRIKSGDAAVRDLVAKRVPLFEFAIKTHLKNYDLATAEGRVAALRESAPLVAKIRDRSLRPEYTRALAGWLGMDIEAVRDAVGRNSGGRESARAPRPDQASPTMTLEREALKIILQQPAVSALWSEIEARDFSDPLYEAIRTLIGGGLQNPAQLIENQDEVIQGLLRELLVEPIKTGEINQRYAESVFARLREVSFTRQVAEIKSKLQRIDPEDAQYMGIFGELVALEAKRRALHDLGLGDLSL